VLGVRSGRASERTLLLPHDLNGFDRLLGRETASHDRACDRPSRIEEHTAADQEPASRWWDEGERNGQWPRMRSPRPAGIPQLQGTVNSTWQRIGRSAQRQRQIDWLAAETLAKCAGAAWT